jgi:hypothetical protein
MFRRFWPPQTFLRDALQGLEAVLGSRQAVSFWARPFFIS